MLQLSQFKHVALATVLGTTALIGSVGHVFAQNPRLRGVAQHGDYRTGRRGDPRRRAQPGRYSWRTAAP